jgi:VCBS repeat protein
MTTTRRRLVAGLSMGLATVLGATAATTSPAFADSTRGGAISRSEVMTRAQYWVDHQPGGYSQSAYSPGPGGDFDYRRDCSGYTSMSWHLNANPSTESIPDYGPQISKSDLKPGDVLNDFSDHVVIFKSWANKAHTRINYYSFGSTPVKIRTNVALNTGTIDSHPASNYKAIRYKNITDDAAENEQPRLADVTGDGFTDLVGVTSTGALLMYSNNIGRDNGVPYSGSGTPIGSGWGNFKQVLGADVTGDGYRDLLAITADGTLKLYSNNIERDNGVPYSAGTEVGHGFGAFTKVFAADVTGDGYTDLVGVTTDGALKLYSNNIVRDNGVPYSASREIGHGFGVFSKLIPADVTGDGYTDLVALKTDGTLLLYSNNIVRDNGVPFSGNGQQIGTGWGGFTTIL